jgi:anti-sigma-K factor RskA
MIYDRPPERIASLADEYVLGTMSRRARRRFERLLGTSDLARAAVRIAEDRLTALAGRLDPVQPQPATWPAITARLGFPAEASTVRPTAPARRRPAGWHVALAAAVVGLALGLGWLQFREGRAPLTEVATLRAEGGPELWVVATDRETSRLRVRASGTVPVLADRAYELWALPEGAAPVSLGLVPATGDVVRTLDPEQRAALASATKVAVSLEPPGGSMTGAPTGPVLYVADVRRI